MSHSLLSLLLAAIVLALAPALPVSAQTGEFAIMLDQGGMGSSTVSGSLVNVPAGATSADVTITLSNGSKRTTTTSAAQSWKFQFDGLYSSGPWIQIAAL